MNIIIVALVVLAILFLFRASMYTPCSDKAEYKSGFRCYKDEKTTNDSVMCSANCQAPDKWRK